MSDDGTGAGLTIPGVMIGSKDGAILKNYFANKIELQDKVEFNINFPFPLKRDYVNVNLWFSLADRKTMNLMLGLGTLLKGLMENIVFKPELVTFNCEVCDQEFKSLNCLSNGRYCLVNLNARSNKIFTPENNPRTPSYFRDLLHENLMQICLIEHLGRKNKKHDFWTYLHFLEDMCSENLNE